jgi:hypothetical protein
MAVPVKFIAKRSLKRIEKGKPISPFQFGKRNRGRKSSSRMPIIQEPKQDLKPLFIIGGALLVIYLLRK